jgi:CRISPR-associated endoribonuclease Cas6
MNLSLEYFSFTRYRLTLEALTQIELPLLNQGMVLKNIFSPIFRRIVCHDLKGECSKCPLYPNCPFGIIFIPKIPLEAKLWTFSRDIPYPFVIKPPLQNKNVYFSGDRIYFEFLIIGKVQWFLPYFLVTFENLGRRGIGLQPGQYRVINLEVFKKQGAWESVYNRQDHMVHLPDDAFSSEQMLDHKANNPERIKVRFLTPILLKDYHKEAEDLFVSFVKQLLHQIQALFYFYCNKRIDLDPGIIERLMAGVISRPGDLHWVEEPLGPDADVQTDQSVKGFLGTMEFAGSVEPFLPLIYLGELIHVGEANSFGQGWYAIENFPGG